MQRFNAFILVVVLHSPHHGKTEINFYSERQIFKVFSKILGLNLMLKPVNKGLRTKIN